MARGRRQPGWHGIPSGTVCRRVARPARLQRRAARPVGLQRSATCRHRAAATATTLGHATTFPPSSPRTSRSDHQHGRALLVPSISEVPTSMRRFNVGRSRGNAGCSARLPWPPPCFPSLYPACGARRRQQARSASAVRCMGWAVDPPSRCGLRGWERMPKLIMVQKGRGEPRPGADAAGVSPVPGQMWQG
jgi:hypothetical protein